ncbi:MAG: cupin domain-containing protein [Janthinobacterium lividum]
MKFPPLTVIDTTDEAQGAGGNYQNYALCSTNDQVVRISIMTEPFYWHLHPNSDETFLVIEGSLYIDLESGTVEVATGQLFTVPQNVRHRTRPKGVRSVNLTFEFAGIETVRLPPETFC